MAARGSVTGKASVRLQDTTVICDAVPAYQRGFDTAPRPTPPRADVPPAVGETPGSSLRGEGRGWKLLGADGGGWPEPVPLDEPGRVVGIAELEQRLAQFLDRVEGPHPEQVLLQGADEALGAAVALGRADEGGRALGAEEGEFLLEGIGKASDMYWLPWSWRTERPWATFLPNAPKLWRTPWRIGSSASKRVARRAAFDPLRGPSLQIP
jgi:hypothetical protein